MSFETFITDRMAALTERLNAIETNAKRTEELPAQDPIDAESEIRVSRGGVSKRIKIQKIVDAAVSLNYDRMLSIGEITLDGNDLTIPALATWSIGNIINSNPSDVTINIPFAATGTSREDLIYANASNQILRLAGPEDANIVVGPNLPLNTVQVTRILVTDSSIVTPSEPIIGDTFVTKISLQDNFPETGLGPGTDWSLSFDGINGKTGFVISGVIVSIADVQIPVGSITPPVLGNTYTITNIKGTPITVKNGSPNNIPFQNPENADIVIPPGCVAVYRYEGSLMRFVSLGIKPGSSDQGIQSAISKDPIITEENILPVQDASGVTFAGNAEDSGMLSVRNNSSDAMPQAQISTVDSFGVPKQGLHLYKDRMEIIDTVTGEGLKYASDLRPTLVDRSLVPKDYVDGTVSGLQPLLVSGGNIKTVGGQSLLGPGNLIVPLSPAIHDTTARTYTGSTSYLAGSYTIPANTIPANCTLILTIRAFKTRTAGTYSISMTSTSTPQVRLLNLVGSGSATNSYMHVIREITIGGGKARYFDTSGSTYHTFAANNAVYANVDFDVTIPQTFNLTIAANSADTVIFDSALLQIIK